MGADIRVDGKPRHRARPAAALRARRSWRPTSARASASCSPASRRAARRASSRVYHLDRGYERIEEKLSALGRRRATGGARVSVRAPTSSACAGTAARDAAPRAARGTRRASAGRARRGRRAAHRRARSAARRSRRSSRFTRRFDGVRLRAARPARAARRRSPPRGGGVPAAVRRDLALAARRIRAFHRASASARGRSATRAARGSGSVIRRSIASASTCPAAARRIRRRCS